MSEFAKEYSLKYDNIINGHAHLCFEKPVEETADAFKNLLEYFGYSALNIASIPISYSVTHNINTFYCKSKLSPNIYASAGLYYEKGMTDVQNEFLRQAKLYRAMGADGYKMLDGKISQYRKTGLKLNDSVFDKFYAYAEENRIPILSHVADPSTYWDKSKMSEYALSRGWYVEPHEPSIEQLRSWVTDTLEKFPDITMVLAHFYFMSDDLDRAAKMFEKYPNLYFDITPGGEMFVSFTNNYDESRAFFKQYSKRIIYGTDLYNGFNKVTNFAGNRDWQARSFLEKSEPFMTTLSEKPIRPLALEDDVMNDIFKGNFLRIYGNTPINVDKALVADEAERIIKDYPDISELEKENIITSIKYFKG